MRIKGDVRRLLRTVLMVTLFISLNIGLSISSTADMNVEIDVEQIGSISLGSKARIEVTVRNSGTVPITSGDALKIKLYIDGNWVQSTSALTLDVGSSKTVALRYKPKSSGRHSYEVRARTHINGKKQTLAHKGPYYFNIHDSGDCYSNYFGPCYEGCMDECIRDTVWKWDMKDIVELDATIFDYAKLKSKGGGEFEPEAIHPILLENGELDLLYMEKNFEISCYIEIRYVDYEDTGPDPTGSYNHKKSDFKKPKYLPPTKLEYTKI